MDDNTKQPMHNQSDSQDLDKGENSQSQDMESGSKAQSEMNQCQTEKNIAHHQERVNETVTKISQLLDVVPLSSSYAYYLLIQLYNQIRMEGLVYIKTEFIQSIVLEFRDIIAYHYKMLKVVEFQFLIYYADIILRYIDGKHMCIYGVEDILINLSQQIVPLCWDFLIENCKPSNLWCMAIAKQGIQLEFNQGLMEKMLELIDKPFAYRVFVEQKKMPFYQEICDKAWEYKKVPDVMGFIISEIDKGGKYFEAFCKLGIYDLFKIFITEALSVIGNNVIASRLDFILVSLSSLWANDEVFNDTEQIFQSRIFDYIANIPIELFYPETLFLILGIVNRIDTNSRYDLNFIILNFTWYQRLNYVLVNQKLNFIIAQNTIERLEELCKGSLSLKASEAINAIISEYKEAMQQAPLPYMMLQQQLN